MLYNISFENIHVSDRRLSMNVLKSCNFLELNLKAKRIKHAKAFFFMSTDSLCTGDSAICAFAQDSKIFKAINKG